MVFQKGFNLFTKLVQDFNCLPPHGVRCYKNLNPQPAILLAQVHYLL